jgi:phosphoglucomutase
MKDYLTLKEKNLITGEEVPIPLPASNVLQFILEDESIISVRPSGTEPKIKFYFSVMKPLPSVDSYHQIEGELQEKIDGIIDSLQLR